MYDTIIDDDIYTTQYEQSTNETQDLYSDFDIVYMHSNIDIKKSLTINQDLNLNNITFNITNSLPIYNTNTMVLLLIIYILIIIING